MRRLNPAQSYRETAVQSASPMGLVVLMYDAATSSLQRAIQALNEGDIEGRVKNLNQTLAIIGELQGSLDLGQGGEVARNLQRFYDLARSMIVTASAQKSPELLTDLEQQFTSLRDAWRQAETQLANSPSQS